MIIYSDNITPRLQYIADFMVKEMTGEEVRLTSDKNLLRNSTGPCINYSPERISGEEFFLAPHPLLQEKNIHLQQPACFEADGYKAFFRTDGDFPFDIFAASFYLLSRYEEYLPHSPDNYGRYAFENSLAFRENFLSVPLVNIWMEKMKQALKEKFPFIILRPSTFTFLPTYDIDEAYAYKHKGFRRNMGGLARSFLQGQRGQVRERLQVLSGKIRDPYDAYHRMDSMHEACQLKPVYFFHMAVRRGKFDKNIPPSRPAIRQLIRRLSEKYNIGIHPSWQSGDEFEQLQNEILFLEKVSGKKITRSRQHYIRFQLPGTFRRLVQTGIRADYSMGYGSVNGFRASVASPFFWYDLEKEESTPLQLFPFCFMDANSFYEQKYSPEQARDELLGYYDSIRAVNGTMITIWHNNFLGTGERFREWGEMYEEVTSLISGVKQPVPGMSR